MTTVRPLAGIDDVMAVRAFIAENYRRAGRGRAWEIRRWEGQWWHRSPDDMAARLTVPSPRIRIWESDGEIIGVAHPEGTGDVHLQLHPEHEDLADEMLAWAEPTLARRDDDGHDVITTFAAVDDEARINLLGERGYRPLEGGETQRWLTMPPKIGPQDVPTGYTMRSLQQGDRTDAAELADLINAAFGHHFAADDLLNFERSPSFDADLMIVAVAPDGTMAAHAGVTIDTVNRLAIVEPVCTHPDHRRLGLASATILEGLRRSIPREATGATIGAGLGAPSNIVYERIGFTESVDVRAWRKQVG